MAIIGPNSHEKLTKYEIRSLLFALIWFYLPLFVPQKNKFVSIFSLTYIHLPLFTYIWPNIALITFILSYLPLFAMI